jgi:hypothetical protein
MTRPFCLLLALSVSAASGCSSGPNADGGTDLIADGADGTADGPDGSQDDGPRSDATPDGGDGPGEGSFLVHVPPDTSLCSLFSPTRSIEDESAMRGRLFLRTGDLTFPRRAESFQGALVDSILFGPERKVPTPKTATGTFQAALETRDGTDYWIYTFRQDFDLEGATYALQVTIPIAEGALGWPAEVTLDADFMTFNVEGRSAIGPGQAPDEVQNFCPCQLNRGGHAIVVDFVNGDRIRMELSYASEPPEYCAGCTILYLLTRAEVTIGGATVTVEDPMRLVYAAYIHNLNPNFRIELPAMLGSVATVTFDNEPCYGGVCRYLDDAGATVGQPTVASCTMPALP